MNRRALVLTLDRIHPGYLGCYGNDWIETPNFDRLATQSVVFDRHFVNELRIDAAPEAWSLDAHRTEDLREVRPNGRTVPAILAEAGVKTWLFTESDGQDAPVVAPPFDEVCAFRGTDSLDAEEDEPPFAQMVQALTHQLSEISDGSAPTLIWLKSRGVPAPWLPPREFADLYLDEFGLAADTDTDDADDDSDEAAPVDELSAAAPAAAKDSSAVIELKYARALYAAYVTWLDRWVGKLLRALEASPAWNDSLIIVTAIRGQSLGERGALNEQAAPLRAELVHTPLFIRLPDRQHDATRRPALVQTMDLGPTLLDWFGVALPEATSENSGATTGRSLLPLVRNEQESVRESLFIRTPAELGVHTRTSLYVQQRSAGQQSGQGTSFDIGEAVLFEKPGDRWDMADVASQDPGECERLRGLLEAHFGESASPA